MSMKTYLQWILTFLSQTLNADNVMVVVTRWYGGIHIGPDRFRHINNRAGKILEDNGFKRSKVS